MSQKVIEAWNSPTIKAKCSCSKFCQNKLNTSCKHFNLVDHCLYDFDISILEIPDSDKSRLLDRIERQWITKLDTFKSGLNSDEGNSDNDACIFSLQHHPEANKLVRAARDWLTKFKTDNKLYNKSQLTITKANARNKNLSQNLVRAQLREPVE